MFGIGPLLAGCLNGMGGTVEGIEDKRLRAEAIQELDVRSNGKLEISLDSFIHLDSP